MIDTSSKVTKNEEGSYSLSTLEDGNAAKDLRERTVERLWSITEDLNILYKENWTRLAAKEILEFQENLSHSLKRKSIPYESVPPTHQVRDTEMDKRRWTFSGSLLYSLTLITTIGIMFFVKIIEI